MLNLIFDPQKLPSLYLTQAFQQTSHYGQDLQIKLEISGANAYPAFNNEFKSMLEKKYPELVNKLGKIYKAEKQANEIGIQPTDFFMLELDLIELVVNIYIHESCEWDVGGNAPYLIQSDISVTKISDF